jgi:hypothetical protein
MENQKEIAALFDEWLETLPPDQQDWCRIALRNTIIRLRNIGVQNAKELIIVTLLYWHSRQGAGSKNPKR